MSGDAVDTMALGEMPAFGHYVVGEPLVASFQDTAQRLRSPEEQRTFVDALTAVGVAHGFHHNARGGLGAMRLHLAKGAVRESSVDDRLADLEVAMTAMVDSQQSQPVAEGAGVALARVMRRSAAARLPPGARGGG